MEIQLNQVPQGASMFTNTKYTPTKKISSIKPSCGCMSATYDETHKVIKLNFRAEKLPPQVLANQGYQDIYKFLTIYFIDGSTEKINIRGKIVQ